MTNTAYLGGSTDVTVYVRGFTASTGLPYTAGAHNTSGLTINQVRNRAAAVAITAVTQTASGAHTDGGFVHIAGGLYRVDITDASVATSADSVQIVVFGVTDVVFSVARIDIMGGDPRSATLAAAANTAIANAVVEAEIDALETYNRTSNTAATITGPTSGATTLTITTDAAYEPIKSIT